MCVFGLMFVCVWKFNVLIFSFAFALSIETITSAVNVAASLTSIATVPGEVTLTVRVAPEPPLPESDRIVPVARFLVNVFEVAPVVCAVERVNEVADAIFATDLVKELIVIKSPTFNCVVKAVPLPVTMVLAAATVTVPVNAEVATFAPALLTTTM